MTYGNDIFVAVAKSGKGNRIMTSPYIPVPTAMPTEQPTMVID